MKYKVAGITFEVVLEAPLSEMEYSPVVLERIAKAARGQAGLDIRPTRAGDDVPHRTLVQTREELLPGAHGLDLSQYAPFRVDDGEPLFSLTVRRGIEAAPELGKLVINVHDQLPYYSIYNCNGMARFTLDENQQTGKPSAILALSEDNKKGVIFTDNELRAFGTVFQMTTALMIMFTYNAAAKDVLLIHSSVIGYKGKANIFLGKSGTGKSTHSRLWLEHIPGTDLLNDDNPALGFSADGKLLVYGTPWSGKTPCYRNICAPVNAIVRLEQAPQNSIAPETGLAAYAALMGSVSAIRWDRSVMDHITAAIEKAAMGVKVFHLDCLPDRAAAQLCLAASFGQE